MRCKMLSRATLIIILFFGLSFLKAENQSTYYAYKWVNIDGKEMYVYGLFKSVDDGEDILLLIEETEVDK